MTLRCCFEESMSYFELTKELASTNSLHEMTTGKNNFKIQKTTLKYNLKCNQFKCVTTHSGKYICGAEINKDRQTYKAQKNIRFLKPATCISRYFSENICIYHILLSQ